MIVALLLENRLDFIKKQHSSGLSTAHDDYAIHRDVAGIVDHFAQHADPTSNKQYTQWIVNKYKDGNFRQEDAPRINDALTLFHAHKQRLPNKDINSYPGIRSVEDAVHPYKDVPVSSKDSAKHAVEHGLDILHSDEKYQINHLKTKQASQIIYGGGSNSGRKLGTDWCTAARSNHNMFDHYARDGKLFTIHINGEYDSPYQYHHPSGQFMNRFDEPAKRPKRFIEDHPVVGAVLAPHIPAFDVDGKHIDQHVKDKHGLKEVARIMLPRAEEKLLDVLRTGGPREAQAISDHITRVTPRILKAVVSNPEQYGHDAVVQAFNHPYADTSVRRATWETEANNTDLRLNASRSLHHTHSLEPHDIEIYRKMQPSLHEYTNHKAIETFARFMDQSDIKPVLDGDNERMKVSLFKHVPSEKFTDEQISYGLNNPQTGKYVLRHVRTPEHFTKVFEDPDLRVHAVYADNGFPFHSPNIPDSIHDELFGTLKDEKSPYRSPYHKQGYNDWRYILARSSGLKPRHIDDIIDHGMEGHVSALAQSRAEVGGKTRITHEQLKRIVDRADELGTSLPSHPLHGKIAVNTTFKPQQLLDLAKQSPKLARAIVTYKIDDDPDTRMLYKGIHDHYVNTDHYTEGGARHSIQYGISRYGRGRINSID